MTITTDLKAISKELMKLVKQTEKLAAALGKAEKPASKICQNKELNQRLPPKRRRLNLPRKLILTSSLHSSIDPKKGLIQPR